MSDAEKAPAPIQFEAAPDSPWAVGDVSMIYNGATFCSMLPTNRLTLGQCGISINTQTGEVTIPDGLSLTDASLAFWDAVQRITGQKVGFE